MLTVHEIEEMAEKAAVLENEESRSGRRRWPGQSYVQGVRAALDWVAENSDEPPLEGE